MTDYQTRVENYGSNGLINTEVIHNILTGEAEVTYLAPDKVKQAYLTLRQWSLDAETESAAWTGQSQAARDAAMATTFHRLSVFFDRFADLLLLEGRT
jgi:hypothetical protein